MTDPKTTDEETRPMNKSVNVYITETIEYKQMVKNLLRNYLQRLITGFKK